MPSLEPNRSAVIKALISTFIHDDPELLSGVDMTRVLSRVDASLGQFPALIRIVFHLTLVVFGYGLPPMSFRFRRFDRLSAEARQHYMESWAQSRFMLKRNAIVMFRLILLGALLQEPSLLALTGYDKTLHRRREHAEGREVTHPCRGGIQS